MLEEQQRKAAAQGKTEVAKEPQAPAEVSIDQDIVNTENQDQQDDNRKSLVERTASPVPSRSSK